MNKKFDIKKLTGSREMSLVVVLVILCAFIQFRNPGFLSAKVIIDMLKNYAVTMILALGMMGVLLLGGIDISIGSTLALSGMCMALLMRDGIVTNTFLAMVISVIVGLVCGLVVGAIIAYGKVLPIIATLGFMNIYRGITYLAAKSQWVAAYQITTEMKQFAQSSSLTFGLLNNLITITEVSECARFVHRHQFVFGKSIYCVTDGLHPDYGGY